MAEQIREWYGDEAEAGLAQELWAWSKPFSDAGVSDQRLADVLGIRRRQSFSEVLAAKRWGAFGQSDSIDVACQS